MKKLSTTQAEVLEKIRDSISFAKQFDNYHDYYIAKCMQGVLESSPHYERILAYYEDRFVKGKDDWEQKYWEDKLVNITLTSCSSATLRALEKLGYIEIINDGGKYIDTVKLIEK